MKKFNDLPIELAEHIFLYVLDALPPANFALRVYLSHISRRTRAIIHKHACAIMHIDRSCMRVVDRFVRHAPLHPFFAHTKILHVPSILVARYHSVEQIVNISFPQVSVWCGREQHFRGTVLQAHTVVFTEPGWINSSDMLKSSPGTSYRRSSIQRLAMPWNGVTWLHRDLVSDYSGIDHRRRIAMLLQVCSHVLLFVGVAAADETAYEEALEQLLHLLLALPLLTRLTFSFAEDSARVGKLHVVERVARNIADRRIFIQMRGGDGHVDHLAYATYNDRWTSGSPIASLS